ncbi:Histidine kinase-like ATPase, ATP-binding domain-containing protein [Artemisia annua]|uniref:Histidine kinase-like ATPase, ATP-binding domain-containing protein n=1 Tax=Artemisia annua TaxID=35608 RepID=A0A2U1P7G3_ARTAN|nr:Histidine kinase-like ATPase, ATP-binding domain-containing protein [Artemisia annua]
MAVSQCIREVIKRVPEIDSDMDGQLSYLVCETDSALETPWAAIIATIIVQKAVYKHGFSEHIRFYRLRLGQHQKKDDDGGGMTQEGLRTCLSLGYSKKKTNNIIMQYGSVEFEEITEQFTFIYTHIKSIDHKQKATTKKRFKSQGARKH